MLRPARWAPVLTFVLTFAPALSLFPLATQASAAEASEVEVGEVAASAAEAGEDDDPVDTGARIYVGASGVASFLIRAEDAVGDPLSRIRTDMSFGVAATYGVRLLAWPISTELDFEYVIGHDFEQTTPLGVDSDELASYTLTGLVAYRPLSGSFDPFVSLGAGWMRASLSGSGASGDGIALRFGVGTDYWFTDHIGLRVEGRYLLPVSGSIERLDTAGARAGVFYRF